MLYGRQVISSKENPKLTVLTMKYFPLCEVNFCEMTLLPFCKVWYDCEEAESKAICLSGFTSFLRITKQLRLERTSGGLLILQGTPAQAQPLSATSQQPPPDGFCSHCGLELWFFRSVQPVPCGVEQIAHLGSSKQTASVRPITTLVWAERQGCYP